MVSLKTPNVYIQELPAQGPITGVGTSTAAFIGPARKGPVNVATKITNWSQFKETFGDFMTQPRRYLAYAVRGFLENGGTVAYVVRVSNGARAFFEFDDRGPAPVGTAIRVEAKQEGAAGNAIQAQVADAQILGAGAARVRRARAALSQGSNNVVRLQNPADAALFRTGDVVVIETQATRYTIDRVRGQELVLTAPLSAALPANAFVRIADLVPGQDKVRVELLLAGATIEPGMVIHLVQAANSEDAVVRGLDGEFVLLESGLANTYDLLAAAPAVAVTSFEFNLRVTLGALVENFTELSMDPRHRNYFARAIDSQLVTVTLPTVPSIKPPPNNRPIVAVQSLANGADENLATLGLNQYQAGLDVLAKVDDISIVAIPDRQDSAAQAALIGHCERLADRFAVLDSGLNEHPFSAGGIITHRQAVESQRGYAALYYPWIRITDPASATGEETILVPPSGYIAGIYARSDDERGVHKAPANELIRGALGLERILDDVEQGELNVEGINVLRIFAGQARPKVWGARTTAPKDQTAWRYVNVRRLFLFVEESIQEGLNWSVFEPNDRGLWKKLDRRLTEFLTRVWRSGALFGDTPAEAFYVKIDDELNPASVRALGQVNIEIGIAPVRPAEFVVVRIGMWDGGSEVVEA